MSSSSRRLLTETRGSLPPLVSLDGKVNDKTTGCQIILMTIRRRSAISRDRLPELSFERPKAEMMCVALKGHRFVPDLCAINHSANLSVLIFENKMGFQPTSILGIC